MQKAKNCERQALADIIDLCTATDAALKSSPLDDYILLERLIVQASSHRKRKVL